MCNITRDEQKSMTAAAKQVFLERLLRPIRSNPWRSRCLVRRKLGRNPKIGRPILVLFFTRLSDGF